MGCEVGLWTDLYLVGVMAYELFVGWPLFDDSELGLVLLLCYFNEDVLLVQLVNLVVD